MDARSHRADVMKQTPSPSPYTPKPNPYGATCRITLDLPWEVAAYLVDHGPALIQAVAGALDARMEDARRRADRRALVAAACKRNKDEWTALAAYCETEIRRRAARRISRTTALRDLAAELGLSTSFLQLVMRVMGPKRRTRNLRRSGRAAGAADIPESKIPRPMFAATVRRRHPGGHNG